MRILIVTNLFPPGISGGFEIECRQIADILFTHGHEVFVLSSSFGCSMPLKEEVLYSVNRSLKLFVSFDQPVHSSMRLKKWWIGRHNFKMTLKLIEEKSPDLIFFWSPLRIGITPARAALVSHVPVVWRIGDENLAGFVPAPLRYGLRNLYRWVCDHIFFPSITLKGIHFDFVSCITETTKARLIAQGVDIRKAVVHYKGIPIEQFPLKKDPGNLSRPIRLLYVGRLHPQKGLNAMVKAFCLAVKMNKHPLTLTLVGTGSESYCHEIKHIAELENVEINFAGFVAYDQLSSIYCEHDIFIFPSNQLEAQGSTYLEAMSSGIPVISTNQGGHGEILKHRKNALIFPQDDINMLVEQMMILIEDQSLRLQLITQARKDVEDHFNFAVTSQTLENFLQQALAQSLD